MGRLGQLFLEAVAAKEIMIGRLDWFRLICRRSIKSKSTLCVGKVRGTSSRLAQVLTSRGVSLKVKGNIYRASIQTVFGYPSETWAMKVEDMARWICGVHLTSRTASAELNSRHGVQCITYVDMW